MHKIKWLKGKYEINTDLPLGEGSSFRVREWDSSSCFINHRLFQSQSGRLERCSLHSPHLICSFGGDEVGEALAGVFLISVFFPPLDLLIGFDFLGWWCTLDALSLGWVGATSSSCTWLDAYVLLDGLPYLVDMALTFSRVGSGCPRIPPNVEEGKKQQAEQVEFRSFC
jgi:hypothetical protein